MGEVPVRTVLMCEPCEPCYCLAKKCYYFCVKFLWLKSNTF